MLTQETLKQLLSYDPNTGIFTWLESDKRPANWNARYAGTTAGTHANGRCQIRVLDTIYKTHRLVWLYVYGYFPEGEIDHINRDVTDNRLVNLREATRSEQAFNTKVRCDNKTGLKGVAKRTDCHSYAVITYDSGVKIQKTVSDFFEACCIRKSWEASVDVIL